MEKVLKQIKRISSATRGIIAEEQLEELFAEAELSEEQRSQVFDSIAADGIVCAPRKDHFEKMLNTHKDCVVAHYAEELQVMAESVIDQKKLPPRPASLKIARAIAAVSRYRADDEKKEGRGCATHLLHARNRLEIWMQTVIGQEKLEDLSQALAAGIELTSEQADIVRILLFHAPHMVIHPPISRFFTSLEDTQ